MLLTSRIIFTASLVLPSFLAHMAIRRLMYTSTLVSLPAESCLTEGNFIEGMLHKMWNGQMELVFPDSGIHTVLCFLLCAVVLQLLAAP